MIHGGAVKTQKRCDVGGWTAEDPRDLAEAGASLTAPSASPEGGPAPMMVPAPSTTDKTPRVTIGGQS